MSGLYERDYQGVVQGQYSTIVRESWQPINFQSGVSVPLGQAVSISLATGILTAITGLAVCHLGHWPARYALLACAFVSSIVFLRQSVSAIAWMRNAYLARDRYLTEKRQGAQAEKTVVSIQWTDPRANNGYSRTVYEDLEIAPEQLSLAVSADRLSKRGLMEAGLNDAQAMRLLLQLLAFGYIVRQADNEPARWTSKGEALRRAFGGGGGGGGGLVDIPATTKTVG